MGRLVAGTGNANAVRVTALLLCCVLVLEYHTALAAIVTVGGNRGWLLGVNFFTWEKHCTRIKLNDTLYFKYPKGENDVVRVSDQDFNHCVGKRPLGPIMTSGEDYFALTKIGIYHFICSIGHRCAMGMKGSYPACDINFCPGRCLSRGLTLL